MCCAPRAMSFTGCHIIFERMIVAEFDAGSRRSLAILSLSTESISTTLGHQEASRRTQATRHWVSPFLQTFSSSNALSRRLQVNLFQPKRLPNDLEKGVDMIRIADRYFYDLSIVFSQFTSLPERAYSRNQESAFIRIAFDSFSRRCGWRSKVANPAANRDVLCSNCMDVIFRLLLAD